MRAALPPLPAPPPVVAPPIVQNRELPPPVPSGDAFHRTSAALPTQWVRHWGSIGGLGCLIVALLCIAVTAVGGRHRPAAIAKTIAEPTGQVASFRSSAAGVPAFPAFPAGGQQPEERTPQASATSDLAAPQRSNLQPQEADDVLDVSPAAQPVATDQVAADAEATVPIVSTADAIGEPAELPEPIAEADPSDLTPIDEASAPLTDEHSESAIAAAERFRQAIAPDLRQDPLLEGLVQLPEAPQAGTCAKGTCAVPANVESYGTALQWMDEPAQAFETAKVQEKLVFLIHISGNFKIPGFT